MSASWAQLSGGFFGNEELSMKVRMETELQTRMGDIVDPSEEFYIGKKAGEKVAFSLYGRIAALADTALNEFQKIPITSLPRYEASATVARYGQAISWTGVREDLHRLDEQDVYINGLKQNASQTENKLIRTALVAGRSFRYTALTASTYSFKSDGTAPTAAASDLNRYHLNQISDRLQTFNTPTFDGEHYIGILSVKCHTNLLDDTAAQGYVDVKKYSPSGVEGLLNGEVGKYGAFRFVVDNDQALNGTNYGEAFFCGAEACKEVLVKPLQILANMNLYGGFGEEMALAWDMMKTYKTVWIYSTHGQGTVLHYEST